MGKDNEKIKDLYNYVSNRTEYKRADKIVTTKYVNSLKIYIPTMQLNIGKGWLNMVMIYCKEGLNYGTNEI